MGIYVDNVKVPCGCVVAVETCTLDYPSQTTYALLYSCKQHNVIAETKKKLIISKIDAQNVLDAVNKQLQQVDDSIKMLIHTK